MGIFQLMNGHIVSKFIKLFQMKFILVVLFFFFSTKGFTQSTDSIKANNISFKWNKWRLNGKRIFKDDVKVEMMKVDEAFLYYKKGRTNQTAAYLAAIPMVTFALLGQQSTNITSPSFGKPKYGFNIAGLLFGGISIYELAQSSKNSKKAASIYNEKMALVY